MLSTSPSSSAINYKLNHYSSPLATLPAVVDLTFIIPVYNEEDSLVELTAEIICNVPKGMSYEIILIDDGSTDDSWKIIQAIADSYNGTVRGFQFRANRGKAAALQVGFNVSNGKVVFTLDADLQDDPREIPRFLAKLDKGYDLVSGWKKVRHDPWHKVLPSRVFNRMLSYFSQVQLHDHNCGFKCYRREVVKTIQIFGELHRMVPAIAGMHGFRVTEIPVQHHARKHGASKYGVERFIRGFSDMLTTGFLRKYRERPSHFANTCSAIYLFAASILLVMGLVIGLTSVKGLVFGLVGLCFSGFAGACFLTGLFCELMLRHNWSPDHDALVDEVCSSSRPVERELTSVTETLVAEELVAAAS